MISLYFAGILCGILYALILKKTKYKGEPVPFVMELPNYRLPSAKSVGQLIWEKAKDFIQKAFTIIFAATLIVWFLQNLLPAQIRAFWQRLEASWHHFLLRWALVTGEYPPH